MAEERGEDVGAKSVGCADGFESCESLFHWPSQCSMMFYQKYIYIYKYHRSTYVAFVMKVHGSRGDEDASAAVPASLLHSRSSAPSAHFSG